MNSGPAGSRGTYAIGTAVIAAAEEARQKLLELVAPMLQADPDRPGDDGRRGICQGHPDKKSWKAMGVDRTLPGLRPVRTGLHPSQLHDDLRGGGSGHGNRQGGPGHVVNATDVGQIIDPPGLEGQLNGCLGSAGIDSALFEETVLDRVDGPHPQRHHDRLQVAHLPGLPPIDNVVLETPFPAHRFHAVGVGEVATSPGPSAVLMAVSNAIGRWLHEYPVTPERVLGALGRVATGGRERGEA